MAPKKASAAAGGITLSGETYTAVCKVMDELALRGPMQEALMMRVAKAAGFTDVMTAIKRRRTYTKKMQGAPAAAEPGDKVPARKGKGKRKKGPASVTPITTDPPLPDKLPAELNEAHP